MAWGALLERGTGKQKEGVQDGHRTPPRDLNPIFQSGEEGTGQRQQPAWYPRGGIQTPCLPHCLNHRVGRGPWDSLAHGAWRSRAGGGEFSLCTGPPPLLRSPSEQGPPGPRTPTPSPPKAVFETLAQEGGLGKASIATSPWLSWRLGHSARPHVLH